MLTFNKSQPQILHQADYYSFSDLFSVYLKTIDHFKLEIVTILKAYYKF